MSASRLARLLRLVRPLAALFVLPAHVQATLPVTVLATCKRRAAGPKSRA